MQNGKAAGAPPAPRENGGVYPEMRLYLSRGGRFFGPGPLRLLALVDETGSLRDACRQMGMSYSKGWKIIVNMEACLHAPMVRRRRGGAARGQSRLTEEGRALMERYTLFAARCQALMEQAYAEVFAPRGEAPAPPRADEGNNGVTERR